MNSATAAINQGTTNSKPWSDVAYKKLKSLAKRREFITTDDLWKLLAKSGLNPNDPRAIGGVMRRAAATGLIRVTDRYTPSTRPECHGRPIRIWESVIYR